MDKIFTIILIFFINTCNTIKGDPCTSYQVLDSENDHSRSAANVDGSRCDDQLVTGWYRITSKAGERMPTECIIGGGRCGTTFSTWMSGSYPNAGEMANVTACASSYNGECCKYSHDIQVKNCTDFLVYKLQPVVHCNQAYCFGTELPCPVGQTSDNGFSPGCHYDPCLEVNYKTLDQWQRSVKNTGVNGTICDNMLQPGWYRPISLAGNMMPTQCQEGGFTCGTINTLWMNGSHPAAGDISNVTACASSYNGGCCITSYNIQVKNCGDFYIYNLQNTKGCYQAYCFGTEVLCPPGKTSDNGYTPGCEYPPQTPTNFTIVSFTDTSIVVEWIPGYDGGHEQTFNIQYRIVNESKIWFTHKIPQYNRHTYTLSGLQGDTGYELRMLAENKFYRSLATDIQLISTMPSVVKEPQEISGLDGGFIGGVVGGVIIILVIILGILFFMRKKGLLDGRDKTKSNRNDVTAADNPINNDTYEYIEGATSNQKKRDPRNKGVESPSTKTYEVLGMTDTPNTYADLSSGREPNHSQPSTEFYEALGQQDKPNVYECIKNRKESGDKEYVDVKF